MAPWEFEDLFDVDPEQSAGLLENYWRDIPTEIRVGRMGYRTRTIKAGPRLEVEIYPLFGRETSGRLRAEKKNLTPEDVQRNNEERSIRQLVRLMDENFGEEDLHLTLTYNGTPPAYRRAKADAYNFLRAVKRRREKAGMPELKYVYSVGGGEGTKERTHVHIVLTGGISREELEEIWEKGYANADHLQPNENGLEALARYLAGQQKSRIKGRRRWVTSRNLRKPKQRTSDTKVSNGRVKRLAHDFPNSVKEIMEKLFQGYGHVKTIMRYSDVVDGVYIRTVMRRWTEDRNDLPAGAKRLRGGGRRRED